ncbi:PREDICTED: RNA polymerase II transcriptional coactivator KELP [Tarenaya hassleriana]|uniref:RNA polymerase II transcriptional coactivator KELP n=1 Tax=Tarenaya hassleriana TaxID=28532 RepID=UPI00053C756E|nr:PREDICTED: RNA polymerase II transcriptional coactivator KELP [Tarenaya hassleriana]
MEQEMKEKIERTVREILEESDMAEMTESMVRKLASEKLGVDLSEKSYKAHVRLVVNLFLDEQRTKEAAQAEEEEEGEEDARGAPKDKELDDEGNLIICRLSDKRRVTIQEFRGRTLVSIREYYQKDGKELPTSKGISLTGDQWSAFEENIPAIEKAIKKMESRV